MSKTTDKRNLERWVTPMYYISKHEALLLFCNFVFVSFCALTFSLFYIIFSCGVTWHILSLLSNSGEKRWLFSMHRKGILISDYKTSVIVSHQERKGRELPWCITSLWLGCLHIHLWYVYSCWSGQRFNRVYLWVCRLVFCGLWWKAWVENRCDTGVICERQLWETQLRGG